MKKNYLFFVLIILFCKTIDAQVKDLSLTFSPIANYTWWSDQAGLEDDFLYGGNIGFGFGEFVELRATHLRNEGIKRDFSQFGLPLGFENILGDNREFNLTRWGGELKANIGSGSFNPFVILGTGVQKIETDFNTDLNNIYASAGLGFKIGFSERIALVLEGRNTVLNANTGLSLLTDAERSSLGLADSFFERERLYNWSALASLQFYLGGRAPGKLSELDKTYSEKLKQGFKGFTFLFEPAATYIDFDANTFIKDTWLLGGYLGFNFNKYLGIRGFYFQATQNEKLFNDLDDLAIYGAELRARLNDGNGVVPYLTLGGGYMNVYEGSYQGEDGASVSSGEFAKGGLGLEIPVSKYFSINTSASSLLTSGQNFENLSNNSDLQTSWAYSVGIHLQIGKQNKKQVDDAEEKEVAQKEQDQLKKEKQVVQEESKESEEKLQRIERELNEKRRALAQVYDELNHEQRRENQAKIEELQNYYQTEIDSLDKNYEKAVDEGRIKDAVDILEKIKNLQLELNKLEELEELNNAYADNLSKIDGEVSTESQNKSAIQSIKNDDSTSKKDQQNNSANQVKDNLSNSIDQQKNQPKAQVKKSKQNNKVDKKPKSNPQDQAVINKLDQLLDQLEENESDIKKLNKKVNKIESSAKSSREVIDKETIIKTEEVKKEKKAKNVEKKKETKKDTTSRKLFRRAYFNSFEYIDEEAKERFYIADFLTYKGLSAFTGFNIGQQGTFNLGSRMHYGIKDTYIEVMPEVSLSISSPFSFGVAVNAVHPFKADLPYNISPYAGIGTGYLYNDEISHLTGNLLIGFYTNAFGGRVYVDYTNRNLFKFNQLAVGYRFKF